ncbi:MAG: formyltetrahydrofolate deformylase [Spirochaetota bacterium]|nr:formyltetrahydrofolate deformylase [Spirochaetota bacterium]
MKRAIALIECADRRGIIAAVSGTLAEANANITQADEHTDVDGRFFMRLAFTCDGGQNTLAAIEKALYAGVNVAAFDQDHSMTLRVYDAERRPSMGILVSKTDHCLVELLYRHRAGELAVDIPFVAGNHEALASIAASYGIPFHYVPVEKDSKHEAEERLLALARCNSCNFLVLARYMQILSAGFIEGFGGDIINIHHSFLPSFMGADPYRQAWERGVKIIGATAHYVTERLDEGPIIEQIVERVTHRDDVESLRRKGKNLERQALYTAVLAHAERRILRCRNKTIVFA